MAVRKTITQIKSTLYGGLFLPMLLNDSPLNHSTTPNSLHSPLIHSTLSPESLHNGNGNFTPEMKISKQSVIFNSKESMF